MEYRLTDGPDSAWANRFLDSWPTDDSGYVELIDFIGAEEEGPGTDDGPPCGGTISFEATTAATEPAQAPGPTEMR
jgi:hypothetical protein